jgi:hypothetical protein
VIFYSYERVFKSFFSRCFVGYTWDIPYFDAVLGTGASKPGVNEAGDMPTNPIAAGTGLSMPLR